MKFGKLLQAIFASLVLAFAMGLNFATCLPVLADGENDLPETSETPDDSDHSSSGDWIGGGVNRPEGDIEEKPAPETPDDLNSDSIDYEEEPAAPTQKPNTGSDNTSAQRPTVQTSTNTDAVKTIQSATPTKSQATTTPLQTNADTSALQVNTEETPENNVEEIPVVPETATPERSFKRFGWVIGAVAGAIIAAAIVSAILFKKFETQPKTDEII